MHILTVIDHPDPKSFTHAVAQSFADGARQAGHTLVFADLHREGFDPRWSVADHRQFETGNTPPDVRAEQQRVEACDALCLVFPLFWFGMPAMTKGWIDRVWTCGWAYEEIAGKDQSRQPQREALFLIPAGNNAKAWAPKGLDKAMDTVWREGMAGYFGFKTLDIQFLGGSEGSDERRCDLLDRAHTLGRRFGGPHAA